MMWRTTVTQARTCVKRCITVSLRSIADSNIIRLHPCEGYPLVGGPVAIVAKGPAKCPGVMPGFASPCNPNLERSAAAPWKDVVRRVARAATFCLATAWAHPALVPTLYPRTYRWHGQGP